VSEAARTVATPGYPRTGLLRTVISFLLAVALVNAVLALVERRADASPHLHTCSLSALHFTLQTNAGLGHGGYQILVRNVGPTTCALTGYPRVRVPLEDRRDRSVQRSLQRVMPPGSFAEVSNTISSYAGGYDGPTTPSGRVALPVVPLTPRTGVASFTLVWIEVSLKACPVSVKLDVGLPGDPHFRMTTQLAFVCSSVNVTPFVTGDTGSWH